MSARVPVHCQTKKGLDYLHQIMYDYESSKRSGTFRDFHLKCVREIDHVKRELDKFLKAENVHNYTKHNMGENDKEGWGIFRELDDKFAILCHYTRRAEYEIR
jgi:hypothetical protein